MQQTLGFVQKGSEDKVCVLKKAVYGLKQASQAWNKTFGKTLLCLGFLKSSHEASVFFHVNHEIILIIAVFVDDILILWNNKNLRVN